ncbi:type IV secretory system conjugative DNA transfer family protein [Botrimarina hoheduenensis]|uniref:Conjugal transfer protein TraG n=1 Tax=Botrimarina hoheduenensis TaxID=2528000 RepID=A0A5C5VZV3_9BACT|nr:type IV secretory system conjugative DNA transfer family protein [Botrimarina hoheduenensis]TWT43473.1 Conjugal transfer protein TraG [Botrimarina hoheduenensis]
MSEAPKPSSPPTLLGQLILCGLASWAAYYFYPDAKQGDGAASLIAIVATIIALVAGMKSLWAFDQKIDRRRRHRQLESFNETKGKAKIGDVRDAKEAGLLGDEGIILGRIGKKLVRYPGEASMLVAGRPGSWKGVAVVILNLLLAPKPTKEKFQSWIVTDFSGELYAVCHRILRVLGYKVVVIASEAERLSRELGVPMESVQHNPAGYLDPNAVSILEDVDTFVHLLHPGVEPGKQNGTTQHFDDLARLVLLTFCLWLLDRYGEVTLPGLRRCVMGGSDEMHCLLEAASESLAFGGALSESASSVLSLMASSPEEFSGAITTATRSVKLFAAGGPVGQQVSRHDFDWGQLKEEATVVFLIVPPERLTSQAQFVNLTISASAEALARHRSNQRVTYLLDEAGNMHLPNLMTIVALYRKFGIQVILVLQQLEAQLARVYGKEAAREIQGNCEVTMAMSTTELEDLKRLSELAGLETFSDGSHTLRESDEGAPEVSYTGDYKQRPVLTTDAIRRLDRKQAVVLFANAPALIVDLVNYLHEPAIRKLADENPYYRKKGA